MTNALILPPDQRSVTAPDGKVIFGAISDLVSAPLGVEPGEIRLLNGFQTGNSGFGLMHIQSKKGRPEQIKGLGFRDVPRFVWHVCQKFDVVCDGGDGRLGLCCEHHHHSLVAYIDWRPDRRMWSVVTALPMRVCRDKLLLNLRTG